MRCSVNVFIKFNYFEQINERENKTVQRGDFVFLMPKTLVKFEPIRPNGGAKHTISCYISETVQDWDTVTIEG